jgi:hypothetical protein
VDFLQVLVQRDLQDASSLDWEDFNPKKSTKNRWICRYNPKDLQDASSLD